MINTTTFVKVAGEKFAYAAVNVNQSGDFVEFDRVNSKTGEISGHLKINKAHIISIEDRKPVI